MNNIPKIIYLQIPTEYESEPFEDIAKIQHVTWCPDKINENDIEYKLSFDVAELEQEHELLKKTLEKQHEITDDLFDKIIKLSKLNDEMLEALKAGSFYIANGELLNKVKSIIEKAEKVME